MMIAKALENLKIAALNEMQKTTLEAAKEDKDLILLSPTGSGKTLGFLLPLLKRLKDDKKGVQALILVPSRELAIQIEQVFKLMSTGYKVNCCYGGHPTKTERNNLSDPPAVLIGTPGRIAYHVRNESFDVNEVRFLVLDEFDKALELGFQDEMSFIISHLKKVQRRILTSATKMDVIPAFADLKNSFEINFLKDVPSAPDLKLLIVRSVGVDKLETLFKLICKVGNKATLVFCNHRDAVERISVLLKSKGIYHDIFHGGMEQEDRERALIKFRNGSHRILITTDLASRGLDIPEIETVVHYQIPINEEAYTHRNGRTARMYAKGKAYLVLAEDEHKPSFIKEDLAEEILNENTVLPSPTEWTTIFIGAGRKDKVNKVDIVGLLLQKGDLHRDELGKIEVLDNFAYAAIKSNKVDNLLKLISNEKIKNKKVKMAVSF